MVENPKPEKIEKLDEVMLAMDVVDTLRHEQLLVERELASDERDQALDLKKSSACMPRQGLEVSDEVIAAGVAALKENRFAYQPPPRGTAWLANLYVRRNRSASMGSNTGCRPGWTVPFLPDRLCGAGSAATSTGS